MAEKLTAEKMRAQIKGKIETAANAAGDYRFLTNIDAALLSLDETQMSQILSEIVNAGNLNEQIELTKLLNNLGLANVSVLILRALAAASKSTSKAA